MQQAKLDLLVLEAQAGDERAFEALYRHFNLALQRFAYRVCGDEQLARDAVQETWITLSKSLRSLKDPRGFRVWAYKTVRWRVVDQVRKKGALTEELSEDMEGCEVSLNVRLATSSQLRFHLAALPVGERTCLALFYLEEMKITEIAAVLETPVGTVKSRLKRARERLQSRMTGEDND